MGAAGKMWRGWKLSGLERLQNEIPGETRVNRFTPQKHDGSKTIVRSENHGQDSKSRLTKIFSLRFEIVNVWDNKRGWSNCSTGSLSIVTSEGSDDSCRAWRDAADAAPHINWVSDETLSNVPKSAMLLWWDGKSQWTHSRFKVINKQCVQCFEPLEQQQGDHIWDVCWKTFFGANFRKSHLAVNSLDENIYHK